MKQPTCIHVKHILCMCKYQAQTPTHTDKNKLLNRVMQHNFMYILQLELSALAALCL